MNAPPAQPSAPAPPDEDLAEQARPGHGIPSQDTNPAAQYPLGPAEAERESRSVLTGGGVVGGVALGAGFGGVVVVPVGVVVGGTLGAVAGALGAAAAGAAMTPEPDAPAPPDPTPASGAPPLKDPIPLASGVKP